MEIIKFRRQGLVSSVIFLQQQRIGIVRLVAFKNGLERVQLKNDVWGESCVFFQADFHFGVKLFGRQEQAVGLWVGRYENTVCEDCAPRKFFSAAK